MITEVRHYWVFDGLPSKEDVIATINAAKEHNCAIILNWKGPGYQWHGDTYKCAISPDDDPDKIFDSLPKSYGL